MTPAHAGGGMNAHGKARKSGATRILAVVAVCTVAVGLILAVLAGIGLRMVTYNMPLVDAAMEIKYETTAFHLWFEELVQGDTNIGEDEEAWEHLEHAKRHARVMLEGGKSPHMTIQRLDDPALRQPIESTLKHLEELGERAVIRLEQSRASLAGSAVDQEFDVVFAKVLADADRVEVVLQQSISTQMQRYRTLGYALGAAVLAIGIVLGFVFFRFERRQESQLDELHSARNELELRVEERTRALRDEITEREYVEKSLFETNESLDRRVSERTEELRAEIAVRKETEDRFRAVLDHTPATIFLKDADGRYLLVNRVFETQHQVTLDEIRGKSVYDMYPKEFADRITAEDREAMGSRDLRPFEAEVSFPDGSECTIMTVRFPVFDAEGNVTGTGGVGIDITEHKHAENALQESESRYHLLFDGMLSGFALHEIIVDADGTPCDYRFLEINPAFEALTGLRAADLVGKTVLQAMPGTEQEWITKYGEVAQTGRPIHFENYAQEFDKYFEVVAFCPRHGQFAVSFTDVSERRRAEEELRRLNVELEARVARRTMDLEAANREMEAFTYSVSHDLRAPLRGIDGFSLILLEEFADALGENGRHYLERVRNGSQTMGRLIDDLLKLSRSTRGDMERQTVDLSEMARGVVAGMAEAYPERNVSVTIAEAMTGSAPISACFARCWRTCWATPGNTPPGRTTRRSLSRPSNTREKPRFASATTAPVSTWPMPTSCLSRSSACTASMNSRAAASVWPAYNASSTATVATCGRKRRSARGRPSTSLWERNERLWKKRQFFSLRTTRTMSN
jgi:PAS domain S-box-containing protein